MLTNNSIFSGCGKVYKRDFITLAICVCVCVCVCVCAGRFALKLGTC
jgi:hypothetical protein